MIMTNDLLTPDKEDELWMKYVVTFFIDGRVKVVQPMPKTYKLAIREKEVDYDFYNAWHFKALGTKVLEGLGIEE